jgi:predicted acetyltransferase
MLNHMRSQDIRIIQASADQQPVLAQLMELYIYEFSQILDLDLNDNGRFNYKLLPKYWEDPNRIPFLIWVDQKLAGFVLVQQGSPIEDAPNVWDIAECFVLRKFRRTGVGRTAAHWVWSTFPGSWQVRVLAIHERANDFWKNAITDFVKNAVSPARKTLGGKDWIVYQFESDRG